MELTPQLRETLAHLPTNGRPVPLDEASIQELVRLGLLEEKAGALGLTQKGAIEKVMSRSMRLLRNSAAH
jgi:hypothetical protein